MQQSLINRYHFNVQRGSINGYHGGRIYCGATTNSGYSCRTLDYDFITIDFNADTINREKTKLKDSFTSHVAKQSFNALQQMVISFPNFNGNSEARDFILMAVHYCKLYDSC